MTTLKFWQQLDIEPVDIETMPENLHELYIVIKSQYVHIDLLKTLEQEQLSSIECEQCIDCNLEHMFAVMVTTKRGHRYKLGHINYKLKTVKIY